MAFHLLLLLIVFSVWETKASSKTPCQSICGDFFIDYPFGVGEACYFNKAFEVTCNNSSGSEKPFLTSMKGEIQAIQPYPSGTMSVNISLNSINSSIAKGLNLSGNFFSFPKEFNRLAAIGCDNYSSINQIYSNPNNITGGCMLFSSCDPTRDRTDCYGFICEVPENPVFDKASLSINLRGCRSSFMVDQYWLKSNYLLNTDALVKRQDYESVPIRLQWGKYRGRCVELYNSGTTICNKDNQCLIQLSSGHYCVCHDQRSDRYQGCTGELFYNMTSSYSYSDCPNGYNRSTLQYNQEPWCTPSKSDDIILVKKSRVEFFVIIGFNAGLGMLLVVIGSWWLYKFIIRRKAIKLKQKFFNRNGGLLLQQQLSSTKGNIRKTNLLTSMELERATDNYNANRILGQGGQGTVYKGMLAEGKIIAIKRSKIVDESKLEEFINEVVILSQINHRNVVQLLGCCLETEVPLLVYEFIPNGTLFQHIHEPSEEFPITWEMRLRIAIDIAGALSYLHSFASKPIFHRDIKSTNILLDDKYRAKISDFGTSRSITIEQTHLSTQVFGTFGYVDPEYFRSNQFTEKSDVYSFGVVLAELLTGQKPIRSAHSNEDKSLAAYFLCAMKENRLFEILDTQILKDGEEEEITLVSNLTRRCLNLNGRKRPTMREVAIELAALSGGSIMQQNFEDIDCVDGGMSSHLETSSSFTDSDNFQ